MIFLTNVPRLLKLLCAKGKRTKLCAKLNRSSRKGLGNSDMQTGPEPDLDSWLAAATPFSDLAERMA